EQASGERRACGGLAACEFHGAAVKHDAARNELQGGGIGGYFSLNEHVLLRRRRFKAGACMPFNRWRRQTHDQGAGPLVLPQLKNQRLRMKPTTSFAFCMVSSPIARARSAPSVRIASTWPGSATSRFISEAIGDSLATQSSTRAFLKLENCPP